MSKWHLGITFLLAMGILGMGTLAPAPRPSAAKETEPVQRDRVEQRSPPFTVPPGFVVERAGGTKTQAAKLLGFTRETLAKKMEKYGLGDKDDG